MPDNLILIWGSISMHRPLWCSARLPRPVDSVGREKVSQRHSQLLSAVAQGTQIFRGLGHLCRLNYTYFADAYKEGGLHKRYFETNCVGQPPGFMF